MPGLYLVQQPSGAKSWAVRYRSGGTPPQAHARSVAGGRPQDRTRRSAARRCALPPRAATPAARRRKPVRKADTIAAVAAQFIERHCRREKSPALGTGDPTPAGTPCAAALARAARARDHPPRRARILLDRVVDSGRPIAANRVLSAVRKMFNWAVARDIIAASPCAGVKPPTAERSRIASCRMPNCARSGSRPTRSAGRSGRS